ncbi:MAG: hypothetical protein IPH03_01080 [Tetrasphaera sp.]|nr:hypothetical protein [Tetrasphaera sp.]
MVEGGGIPIEEGGDAGGGIRLEDDRVRVGLDLDVAGVLHDVLPQPHIRDHPEASGGRRLCVRDEQLAGGGGGGRPSAGPRRDNVLERGADELPARPGRRGRDTEIGGGVAGPAGNGGRQPGADDGTQGALPEPLPGGPEEREWAGARGPRRRRHRLHLLRAQDPPDVSSGHRSPLRHQEVGCRALPPAHRTRARFLHPPSGDRSPRPLGSARHRLPRKRTVEVAEEGVQGVGVQDEVMTEQVQLRRGLVEVIAQEAAPAGGEDGRLREGGGRGIRPNPFGAGRRFRVGHDDEIPVGALDPGPQGGPGRQRGGECGLGPRERADGKGDDDMDPEIGSAHLGPHQLLVGLLEAESHHGLLVASGTGGGTVPLSEGEIRGRDGIGRASTW